MAIMKITEYATAIGAGALQVPQEPPLAVQTIDFIAGSTASAALNGGTRFVSVQLDVDGYIHFDNTPVATSATSRIHKANAVSWHGVNKDLKIAALAI